MHTPVSAPGATLGILGGGQLGRMTVLAGRQLGYRFHIYTPEKDSPASAVADASTVAPFDDTAALQTFAKQVDRVTFEFENIPATTLQHLEATTIVHPQSQILRTCQNRLLEKNFLKRAGFPCAPFAAVHSPETLAQAIDIIGTPCVLKSTEGGYDGKGQVHLKTRPADAAQIWHSLDAPRAILEQWVDFEIECSVICARNEHGQITAFPVAENHHHQHILHSSIAPARLNPTIQKNATDLALAITQNLEIVGILAVEFFVTHDAKLLVNELAPRPHNSGHYSLDACLTSQFEQHIRAVCGLPLGATDLLHPTAMINLLGDLWHNGHPPNWNILLNDPKIKLHLYGKRTPRKGRKMGHFCISDSDLEQAESKAKQLFKELNQPN